MPKEKEAKVDVKQIQHKFYYSHPAADPHIKELIAYLQRKNSNSDFVEKTIQRVGLPVWNKSQIYKNGNWAGRGQQDSVTYTYIPFSRENENLVNASLIIQTTPTDTTTSWICDWQYKDMPRGNATTPGTAENTAMFFMEFQHLVFGDTSFILTDSTLFANPLWPSWGTGLRKVRIKLNSTGSRTGRQSNQVIQCTDIYYCGTPTASECIPDCDYSYCHYNFCWLVDQQCECIMNCNNNGGGSNPPPGSGGSSGSGGSGGGTPPPPECEPPVANRGMNAQPPGTGCPPGWNVPPPPCDEYITALKNDPVFAANFQSLNQPGIFSLNYEKGLYITNRTGNSYVPMQGDPGSPSIILSGPTVPMDGFLHSHYSGLNPMFSPDDVLQMAEAYLKGLAKDSNNLFFGVTHTCGFPYLIKVTNTSKFRKFAEKIIEMEYNSKKSKRFSHIYENSFNTTSTNFNEKAFLDMLIEQKAGNGVTLYRAANNQCNQWIKLERNNFSATGIDETPCN